MLNICSCHFCYANMVPINLHIMDLLSKKKVVVGVIIIIIILTFSGVYSYTQ